MTQAAPSAGSIGNATRGDSVVICQHLTKVFKDFWRRDRARAVSDLSIEIRPREIFGLLGPNGSGKSTTIKMILGLLHPTSGRVAVFGKPATDVSVKARIGYLPEESYLYGFLNARETLEYYAKLFELDYKTRQRRIDELLDMVGLTGAQFRPVREYSKGMQRRIGIAQALINDPDFLILDEPTTGLDPIGTRQVKDLIIQLGRRGKTILLSSHLLADVEDCVDRLVILYGGQVRAEGTCDDLLVTRGRTTIETDELDDATIAEVDRVIRGRTGNHTGVDRVSKPRQTLEQLFLDIVEKARAEQLSTSGATAGGRTASFLAGEEPERGEVLIENLVRAAEAPAAPAEGAPPALPPTPRPEEDLLASLVRDESPGTGRAADTGPESDKGSGAGTVSGTGNGPAGGAAAPGAPKSVDASVIDSLLGGGDDDRAKGGAR
ncbi:MAG: ABC transporter ATP-binding protein [Planctomycetota bacterium]|nr:ABC transporter ATP-binding protein [Planctomycetota bacterium]